MTTKTNNERLFNPLNNSVIVAEIKEEDRNIDTYYQQIKSNFYIGVKADFIIARDVFDASVNLKPEDFGRLTKKLNFSKSTVSKYKDIGGDDRLNRLFIAGKLPLNWTTMYYMSKLNDEQFSKVEKVCHVDITKKEVDEAAEVSTAQQKAIENLLFKFLNLEVNISEVKPHRFDDMISEITDYLKNFPEIKVDDEKVSEIKKRIDNYKPKQTTKNANESKSDEITSNDTANVAEDILDMMDDDTVSEAVDKLNQQKEDVTLDEHLKESAVA